MSKEDPDPARVTLDGRPAAVRVEFGGETIAETSRAIVLRERGLPPVAYVPREDVRLDRLVPSERVTHCPYKGDARYWSVEVGTARADDAVWSYEAPIDAVAPIAGCMAFYGDRMDVVEVD